MEAGSPVESPPFQWLIYEKLTLVPFPNDFLELSDGVPLVNVTITTKGGVPDTITYRVTSGALPQGVSLDQTTGALVGTPMGRGFFDVQVQGMDSLRADSSLKFTIGVSDPRGRSSLSPGAIAGISLGAIAGAALLVVATMFLYRKWNASRGNVEVKDGFYALPEDTGYKY